MAEDYRALAEKCRSLARRMTDDRAIEALQKLAAEYDVKAEAEPPDRNEIDGPKPRPE
jgi:hypothetical protein